MLEQGPDFWCWFDTTQFSYIPLCSPNTCKYVFNPNVTTFQSNCAEGLHFSAFIILINYYCCFITDHEARQRILFIMKFSCALYFSESNSHRWKKLVVRRKINILCIIQNNTDTILYMYT